MSKECVGCSVCHDCINKIKEKAYALTKCNGGLTPDEAIQYCQDYEQSVCWVANDDALCPRKDEEGG